jgi:hypothetical protein
MEKNRKLMIEKRRQNKMHLMQKKSKTASGHIFKYVIKIVHSGQYS